MPRNEPTWNDPRVPRITTSWENSAPWQSFVLPEREARGGRGPLWMPGALAGGGRRPECLRERGSEGGPVLTHLVDLRLRELHRALVRPEEVLALEKRPARSGRRRSGARRRRTAPCGAWAWRGRRDAAGSGTPWPADPGWRQRSPPLRSSSARASAGGLAISGTSRAARRSLHPRDHGAPVRATEPTPGAARSTPNSAHAFERLTGSFPRLTGVPLVRSRGPPPPPRRPADLPDGVAHALVGCAASWRNSHGGDGPTSLARRCARRCRGREAADHGSRRATWEPRVRCGLVPPDAEGRRSLPCSRAHRTVPEIGAGGGPGARLWGGGTAPRDRRGRPRHRQG